MMFQDGFEGSFPGRWDVNGSSPTVVAAPQFTVEEGTHAMDALWSPAQSVPDGVSLRLDSIPLMVEEDYWVGFGMLVLHYIQPYPSWIKLMGINGVPGPAGAPNWACSPGHYPVGVTAPLGRLAVNLNTHPDPVAVDGSANGAQVYSGPLLSRRWTRWTVHVVPSPDATGVADVWLDGTQVAHQLGPNVERTDACGHPVVEWNLSLGGTKEDTNTSVQEVLFDNVKIAHGSNGYDVVQ